MFFITINMITNFWVFAITNIDKDDEGERGNTLPIFIVTNIAIYSSFLIIKLLS